MYYRRQIFSLLSSSNTYTCCVSVCVAACVVCVFVCVDTRVFIWRLQVDVQRLPQLFSAFSTEVEPSFPPHPELANMANLVSQLA